MELSVIQEVDKLDRVVNNYATMEGKFITDIENKIDVEISIFRARVDLQIGAYYPVLTSLVADIYIDAEYHLACAMWHASPSLMAFLIAAWGVIVAVYKGVKWVIDLLHVKELLVVVDVLKVVWPEFREKMNAVYAKISEFSESVGWGLDGIQHLIQACQGGVGLLGGILGKDEDWLTLKASTVSLKLIENISNFTDALVSDPGYFMDVFFIESENNLRKEAGTWIDKTSTWLAETSEKATGAVSKINDVLDEFAEAQNALPAFIRNNIPQAIWDGLTWANDKIDETLLPALTRIDKTLSEINATLEAQRAKASALADQLAHPGDLLSRIDQLEASARALQEAKIDDVAGRAYNEATDKYELDDAGIIENLESVAKAMSVPFAPPSYLALEGVIRNEIVLPGRIGIETWFVGDF